MTFWTAQHLARTTGGRLCGSAPVDGPVGGISIDTRTLRRGEAYLALRGERYDGHDFLDAAEANGASLLIVGRGTGPGRATAVLEVDNTLEALQRMASTYRDHLATSGTRLISVSGSNGKTTCRHLIHGVLSSHLRGTQSPRSFNNHVGVPLTILAAVPGDDFVVAELGTNHPGEIDALGAIARPDAAVITNIGDEHLEFFGTRQAVAAEEAAILKYVVEGGLLVLPTEEDGGPWPAAGGQGRRVVRTGVDLRVADLSAATLRRAARVCLEDGLVFTLPLLGRHNIDNALGAVAVARWMQVPDDRIAAALARVAPMPMRTQVLRFGRDDEAATVIHDAYNANPDSMRRALDLVETDLAVDGQGCCVLIVGDMLELGEAAAAAHRELGRRIAQLASRLRLVVLIGPLTTRYAAEQIRRGAADLRMCHFEAWAQDVPRRIGDMLRGGDIILLKASRGIGLERLLPAVEQRFGACEADPGPVDS